jgi:outer membrane protein
MKDMKIKILLLSLAAAFIVNAQQKVLSLDDAISVALKNNKEIRIAELNVSKAESAVNEAFGYALPSVDLSFNFSHFLEKPKMAFPDFESMLTNATYSILFDEGVIPRNDDKFKAMDSKLQSFAQTNNYESKVQLTQTLFNSAVFRGIGASQIYANLSKEELNRVTAVTTLNVKRAFYGTLLTQELLNIMVLSHKNAQDNLRNVKAVYNEGLVSEFDMLQAEVRVENIKPVLQQMENSLRGAKDGLKLTLGIDPREEIAVKGELAYEKEPLPEIEDLISVGLESNLTIRTLKVKRDIDEEFIALDRSEYWPALYGFANYTYAGSSDDFKFNNYSSAMVGVSFQMNLFQGMRTKNKVQQSVISVQQTDEQIDQLRHAVTLGIRSKYDDLKRVKSSIEAQERNVKLADRAYEIALIRYREGTGNQLEVENADLALKQARINETQSIYDYLVAKAELDELLGRINENYYKNK